LQSLSASLSRPQAQTFERRHGGRNSFGYASIHDAYGRIIQQSGRVRHRTDHPWTRTTVKNLWRRRDVYRGLVVKTRSVEPDRRAGGVGADGP
jgi:hypothetical protein